MGPLTPRVLAACAALLPALLFARSLPAAGAGYQGPAPFTRFENRETTTRPPFSAVGRLFYTRDGRRRSCTAAVIGRDAVLTAARCLHPGDGSANWSRDVVFVPGLRGGEEPFGRWRAQRLVVPAGWRATGAGRFDVGGAVLARRDGRGVGEATGTLGVRTQASPVGHWMIVGYPVGDGFDGTRQVICAASFARGESPGTIAAGCDMEGAAGAAWIAGFSGEGGEVNGVLARTSGPDGRASMAWSPWFGAAAAGVVEELTGAR